MTPVVMPSEGKGIQCAAAFVRLEVPAISGSPAFAGDDS
jgi:hypothetical protein